MGWADAGVARAAGVRMERDVGAYQLGSDIASAHGQTGESCDRCT